MIMTRLLPLCLSQTSWRRNTWSRWLDVNMGNINRQLRTFCTYIIRIFWYLIRNGSTRCLSQNWTQMIFVDSVAWCFYLHHRNSTILISAAIDSRNCCRNNATGSQLIIKLYWWYFVNLIRSCCTTIGHGNWSSGRLEKQILMIWLR